LYAGMHNEKKFLKLKERFKQIEDLIGGVDYYDNFAKDFLADAEMPSTIRMFLEGKRDEKLAQLNASLLKRKWINHDPTRTKRIRKRLKGMDWLSTEKELELIKKFYQKSIEAINTFYKDTGATFANLEEQVHELRRRLRWLSIYPQALQGAIQLKDSQIKDVAVEKYLTPEIVNSPFNKMPEQGNTPTTLLLEKNYFLALSNIISTLGKLKDRGLRVIVTAEAVKATQFVQEDVALQRAFELNKMNMDGLKNIMSEAHAICSIYFEEKNLDKLIAN
jgi:hypothetical protein